MKFKAAILVKQGSNLVIDTIQSQPLKSGQVLVKVDKAGLCGSQLFEIAGDRGKDAWLPHLLGHEAIGKVIDHATDVKTITTGDIVILSWIKADGISAEPAKYYWEDNIVNSGRITTFSEYTVISEDRCIRVDSLLADKVGPALGCALPTGYGMAMHLDKLKNAEHCGIIGLGGIGMAALLGVVNESNATPICIDIREERLNQAKSIGAKHVINSKYGAVTEKIFQATNGRMLDVAIECSGNILALQQCLNLINNNGIVKFATHPKCGDLLKIDPFELIIGKRIEGSWGGGVDPLKDFNYIASVASRNKVFLELYTTKEYGLESINIALDDMRSGRVLRPIINMEHKE